MSSTGRILLLIGISFAGACGGASPADPASGDAATAGAADAGVSGSIDARSPSPSVDAGAPAADARPPAAIQRVLALGTGPDAMTALVVGAGKDHDPVVMVYDACGAVMGNFLAYPAGFTGGVRV